MSERVYVFLDESGNLDFSDRGTCYFVLTSVSLRRRFQMNREPDGYKYDCVEYGLEQERFHCANDNAHVRNRIFDIMSGRLDGTEFHRLVVEKSKTGADARAESRFYPEMLGYLPQIRDG